MINVGDVLSYLDVCREEGVNLQRGMNFRLHGGLSVILMSIRAGAPYTDRIEKNGRVLIYEGHDAPKLAGELNPKTVDQPMYNPTGSLTQNGLFYEAANSYKQQKKEAELVKSTKRSDQASGPITASYLWIHGKKKATIVRYSNSSLN